MTREQRIEAAARELVDSVLSDYECTNVTQGALRDALAPDAPAPEQEFNAKPPRRFRVSDKVYEAVDATTPETYWTLGIWTTLEAAREAVAGCKEPGDLKGDHFDYDDFCRVEIRERTMGWGGVGKTVATYEWTEHYDEDKDEYEWRMKVKL